MVGAVSTLRLLNVMELEDLRLGPIDRHTVEHPLVLICGGESGGGGGGHMNQTNSNGSDGECMANIDTFHSAVGVIIKLDYDPL